MDTTILNMIGNYFSKKQKIIVFLTFLISFVYFFNISSYAHPGRTDSNGGHYNHDTGEYHYHSGESAGKNSSQVTDSTEQNSVFGMSDEEKERRKQIAEELVVNNIETTSLSFESATENTKQKYDIGDILSICFEILGIIIFIGLFILTYIYPIFATFFKKTPSIPPAPNIETSIEPESKNITAKPTSTYESLIPEFIPPESSKNTERPVARVCYKQCKPDEKFISEFTIKKSGIKRFSTPFGCKGYIIAYPYKDDPDDYYIKTVYTFALHYFKKGTRIKIIDCEMLSWR